jgi:hypothetical protein
LLPLRRRNSKSLQAYRLLTLSWGEHTTKTVLAWCDEALEALLFGYVWAGVRKRGVTLAALSGGRWSSLREVMRDVAIAIPFWIVWQAAAGLARSRGETSHEQNGSFGEVISIH